MLRWDERNFECKAGELQKLDAELLDIAVNCIGSVEGAASWLTRPALGLDGKIPIIFSATPNGRAAVIDLLRRIHYGVLA